MKRLFLYILVMVTAFAAMQSCTDFREEEIPVSFGVNVDALEFASAPSTRAITVSSGKKWDVTSLPSWISLGTITRSGRSPYEWSVNFSASANDEYNREGIIILKASTDIAEVSVTQEGKKGKYVAVESVSVSPKELTLTAGENASLTFAISPSNASVKDVTWKTSDSSIATVSQDGRVVAVAEGTALITLTTKDGNKTASCSITVNAKVVPVTGVSLNKTSLSMTEGDTQTLTATVTPSDATDKSVTWSSNKTSVATVSSSGVVTAKAAGTATITVKTNNGAKTATCSVTVTAATVSVTGVSLNKSSLSMTVGDTQTLTATITPSNATNKSVTWSSSNTSVATVSSSGLVTAKSTGNATITVKTVDGGKTATCSVTVQAQKVSVTGVSLNKTSLSMTVGDTQTLTATVTPSNATDKSVTWSSSNTSVATVTSAGLVTAKAAGTAIITVTTNDGAKTATCSVTISEIRPTIYLTFASEGSTTITLQNNQGNTPVLYYSRDAVNWSQWNYGTLSFAKGSPLYMYGQNPSGFSKSFECHSVFVATGSKFSCGGDIMSLIDGRQSKSSIPSNYCFRNLFKDCSLITAGPTLPATTLTQGCYQGLYYKCSGLLSPSSLPAVKMEDTCYNSMYLGCTSLTNAPDLPASSLAYGCYDSMFDGCTSLSTAPSLPATTLAQYCYARMFKDCTSLTRAPELPAAKLAEYCYAKMFINCSSLQYIKCLATDLSYYGTNPATQGWVSGVASSGTFVKSSSMNSWPTGDDGIPKGWTVTNDGQVSVTSVSLNYTNLNMTVGDTQTLVATVSPSNATDKSVTWSSSNTTIASVSSSGVVTAKAAGSATITVTTNDGGKKATCSVSVSSATVSVTGVSLNKTSLTMTVGDTQTLTATITPSNATDKSVTWSSNKTSVATVSSSGVVTAKAAGTATITVTTNDGGKKATCTVTVKAATVSVTGVSLDKTSLSMKVGDTQALTASVTPSNATDKSVTWSSSNTSVATVSSSGVVTAKSVGSTTITVTTNDGGKTATCTVSVTPASQSRYLTFTSTGTSKVGIVNKGSYQPVLYYSFDAVNWTQWDYSPLSFTQSSPVYICGKNPNGISNSDKYNEYSYFTLSGSTCYCSGSIMSLIDKDRDVTTIPSNGCFYSLFDECDLLLSAPDLPATDLTIMCYACMFRACTHLKSGPDVLPASIVGYRCYYGMFMGCTELTSAPTLPATEFYGEDCYALMFMNCKNLTKAPELPAKYTYDGCYRQMFYGCSKLSYIKCLAVDINESTYYNVQYWLDGVSSTGTFVKSKSATSWPVGINGIPSGWTVVDE